MVRENASFPRVMSSLADSFGRECVPVQLPVGSEADFTAVINLLDPSSDVPTGLGDEVEDARERLIEAAAESDDELEEKYLEGEEITQEELIRGLRAGLRSGDFVPVLFGASQNEHWYCRDIGRNRGSSSGTKRKRGCRRTR